MIAFILGTPVDGGLTHAMSGTTPGYAVGWFTLALINAGLAQSKGRSGGAWFLASLFLGPIATLLVVVSGRPAGPAGR
jgi:hypothetical protein